MDDYLFADNYWRMPKDFRDRFKAAARYPQIVRNQAFLIGYVAAMEDYKIINHELSAYWIALLGQFYDTPFFARHIQEMMREFQDG